MLNLWSILLRQSFSVGNLNYLAKIRVRDLRGQDPSPVGQNALYSHPSKPFFFFFVLCFCVMRGQHLHSISSECTVALQLIVASCKAGSQWLFCLISFILNTLVCFFNEFLLS